MNMYPVLRSWLGVTLASAGLLICTGTFAQSAAVLQPLDKRIDWRDIDMDTVQPARVRLGSGLGAQNSTSDEGTGKKLDPRWLPPLDPRYRPGYAGQPYPARLAPRSIQTSAAVEIQSVSAPLPPFSSGWLHSDGVSATAYYPSDAFPFNVSRVNMYGDTVTDRYPYRTVGVVIVMVDEELYECNGALIGPGIVLTAAHCLSEFGGDIVDAAAFIPAYHVGEAPFGFWPATDVAVAPTFSEGTSNCVSEDGTGCDDDVAIAVLEPRVDARRREFQLGEKIGWLGFGLDLYGFATIDSERFGQVTEFGYPSSHDAGEAMQRNDKSAVFLADDNIIASSSPFGVGISGAPNIVNFGEPAILEEGRSPGVDADANVVTAVTTSVADLSGIDFAAYLSDDNLGVLIDVACGIYPAACDTDFDDPVESRDMLLNLEEPANNGVYSGVGNLRGWAVYEFGVESIEVYIDGEFNFLAPYGGERNDVGNAFPDIPNANLSGFSLAFGYGNLEAGEHIIEVIARSSTGDFRSRRATFNVIRFEKDFISAEDEVSVDNADVTLDGKTVILDGVEVDGMPYTVELQWQTATQGFDIQAIEKLDP